MFKLRKNLSINNHRFWCNVCKASSKSPTTRHESQPLMDPQLDYECLRRATNERSPQFVGVRHPWISLVFAVSVH